MIDMEDGMILRRHIIAPIAALFLLTACSSGGSPDPSRQPLGQSVGDRAGQPTDATEATATMTEDTDAAAVRAALNETAADPSRLEAMHLFVECQGDAGLRTLEAFGSGVGIWEKRRQFELAEADLLALVGLLQDADFGALNDLYGGPQAPDPRPREDPDAGFGIEIICRIELSLGEVSKTSAQRRKGEQSEALKQLADDLFARAEGPARDGVEADNLTDALEKLGSGDLAPETLTVMLHQRPEVGSPGASGGFLLRLDGVAASNAVWTSDRGYTDRVVLRLRPEDVGAVAMELASATPDELPINLYADELNDVVISVLDHKVNIQARRFAGMEPGQHGEKQQRFDAIVDSLARLGQRVLAEGDGGPRDG